MSSKEVVDEIIADLNRIPKTIKSDVLVDDMLKEIQEKLKREQRRVNSYV